jgi:hypothetical protein
MDAVSRKEAASSYVYQFVASREEIGAKDKA